MIIKVNYFEMKIIQAIKNEQTKLWTGTGTMYIPSLKANVLMEFKDIHINKDQRLVAGHIHSVRAPKLMTKVKLPPVKQAKKICLTYGPDGYDEEGYNKDGYDRAGYNKEGKDKEGYDKLGYNAQNVDRNGNPKQTPPTQGNPTASSGTNTNGNNSTQTGTSGSTSGQGGSGGNTTSTGTNGNSGGATPTTSVEEDAFTLELVRADAASRASGKVRTKAVLAAAEKLGLHVNGAAVKILVGFVGLQTERGTEAGKGGGGRPLGVRDATPRKVRAPREGWSKYRDEILRLRAEHPDWSARAIARELRVSHELVSRYIRTVDK
jgi:hypothetical protein